MNLSLVELEILRSGLDAWHTLESPAHMDGHKALSRLEKLGFVGVSRKEVNTEDIAEKIATTWTTTEAGRRAYWAAEG